MTNIEMEKFKFLFDKYCKKMKEKDYCDGYCVLCRIGRAYDSIFNEYPNNSAIED